MRNAISIGLSLALVLGSPVATLAQQRGGGGGGAHAGGGGGARPSGGGGGGAHAAPASRPAPQQQRSAPSQPTRPSGGYQLNNDTPKAPAAANRNGGGSNVANRPNVGSGNTTNNVSGGNHANVSTGGHNNVGSNNTINKNTNVNVNNNHQNNYNRSNNYGGHTVVYNPVYPRGGPAYGWNHGVAWYPAPNYWGGGFWGSMAIGVTSAAVGAAVYGSIVNSSTNTTYTSYQIQPNSPGSTLLSNYHLQQVQCGPPGLVVIYGPSNSVICANPNSMVAAGEYNIDTEGLSLVSAN